MKCILFLLSVCLLNEIIYGLNQASLSTESEEDSVSSEGGNVEESDEQSDVGNVRGSDVDNDDDSLEDYDDHSIELKIGAKLKAVNSEWFSQDTLDSFIKELSLGDRSDVFATNRHHFQPDEYKDFGRRFVLQYPYSDVKQGEEDKLMPKQAPPEVVLAVAKESALLEASKKVNPSEHIMTDTNILRNGDYWNGVWQEDVTKTQLRSKNLKKQKLTSVKAKIMPGSELHELISKLKRISPRLLYVINKESKR